MPQEEKKVNPTLAIAEEAREFARHAAKEKAKKAKQHRDSDEAPARLARPRDCD